jgi:CheY-like chemotaxis protein
MASSRPRAPILVVEDNADTRDAVGLILDLHGYAVVPAADGQEALDYLRAGHPVALVVLDLRMPIMDGWTLLREVQADPMLRDVPVVAFSANIQDELPGAVATIRKGNVDPTALLAIIERACRDPETSH